MNLSRQARLMRPLITMAMLIICPSHAVSSETSVKSVKTDPSTQSMRNNNSNSANSAAKVLTVLTWGGAYEDSQRAAHFEPFEQASGVRVETVRYNGGLDELRAEVETGEPHIDVADLVSADAQRACRENLLAPLNGIRFEPSPEGLPAALDFDSGAMTDCSIIKLSFSTVIAFNPGAFPAIKPRRIADFFDIEHFQGKRGLRCAPEALLEWALLAYRIPYSQVYDLLSTDRGLDLAFRNLNRIRPHIVWWHGGEEPVQLLADGTVSMSSGYNGRFFNAQVVARLPISVIWDGQLIDQAAWTILRGTSRQAVAEQFLVFATRAENMAQLDMHIAYAPTRASARRRVGAHVGTGAPMVDHLPTSGNRLAQSVRKDSAWYASTEALRQKRFQEWLRAGRTGDSNDTCESKVLNN